MNLISPRFALALASVLLLPAAGSAQAVIQEWTFFKSSTSLSALPAGWKSWTQTGALPLDTGTTGVRFGTSGAFGWDRATAATSTVRGAMLGNTASSGAANSAYITTYTFATPLSLTDSIQPLGSIVWDQSIAGGNGFASGDAWNDAVSMQLMVQAGGQWYVSSELFKNAKNGNSASMQFAETKTFNLASATIGLGTTHWSAISFGRDAGDNAVPLSVAGAEVASALGDTISGFGFLINLPGAGTRVSWLDNIQVIGAAAVPEPSTWATLAGAGALAASIVRRRRVRR